MIKMTKIAGQGDDGRIIPAKISDEGALSTENKELFTKLEAIVSSILTAGNYVATTRIPDAGFIENRVTTYSTDILTVPDGAKGLIAHLMVKKASGVFAANQGLKLRVNQFSKETGPSLELSLLYYAITKHYDDKGDNNENLTASQAVIWYPGINHQYEITHYKTGAKERVAFCPLPLFGRIQVQVEISGDFSDPEHTGFDFYVILEWLYA